MQKPAKGNEPRPLVGQKGRFIGLVGTGKERYQVHLIETVGETVVKREILSAGRTDKLMVDGKPVDVQGDGLASAKAAFTAAVSKRLMDVSDLWKR